jgi:phosphoenolpyruvate mutase
MAIESPSLAPAGAVLRELFASGQTLRIMEAHCALSARIAEDAMVSTQTFDALWSSSLCESALLGAPDIELVSIKERVQNCITMQQASSLPIIFDGDTGGDLAHIPYNIRTLERGGVAAVVLEDKVGLKRNSLLGVEVPQFLADTAQFAEKLSAAKGAQRSDSMMLFARLEGLCLDQPMDDTLHRAGAYVAAGADGVLIHSRSRQPTEILTFVQAFRKDHPHVPIIVVPTTYGHVPHQELADVGVSGVIYANHMLRAAVKAMAQVAEQILIDGNTVGAEELCIDSRDLIAAFDLAPVARAKVEA